TAGLILIVRSTSSWRSRKKATPQRLARAMLRYATPTPPMDAMYYLRSALKCIGSAAVPTRARHAKWGPLSFKYSTEPARSPSAKSNGRCAEAICLSCLHGPRSGPRQTPASPRLISSALAIRLFSRLCTRNAAKSFSRRKPGNSAIKNKAPIGALFLLHRIFNDRCRPAVKGRGPQAPDIARRETGGEVITARQLKRTYVNLRVLQCLDHFVCLPLQMRKLIFCPRDQKWWQSGPHMPDWRRLLFGTELRGTQEARTNRQPRVFAEIVGSGYRCHASQCRGTRNAGQGFVCHGKQGRVVAAGRMSADEQFVGVAPPLINILAQPFDGARAILKASGKHVGRRQTIAP